MAFRIEYKTADGKTGITDKSYNSMDEFNKAAPPGTVGKAVQDEQWEEHKTARGAQAKGKMDEDIKTARADAVARDNPFIDRYAPYTADEFAKTGKSDVVGKQTAQDAFSLIGRSLIGQYLTDDPSKTSEEYGAEGGVRSQLYQLGTSPVTGAALAAAPLAAMGAGAMGLNPFHTALAAGGIEGAAAMGAGFGMDDAYGKGSAAFDAAVSLILPALGPLVRLGGASAGEALIKSGLAEKGIQATPELVQAILKKSMGTFKNPVEESLKMLNPPKADNTLIGRAMAKGGALGIDASNAIANFAQGSPKQDAKKRMVGAIENMMKEGTADPLEAVAAIEQGGGIDKFIDAMSKITKGGKEFATSKSAHMLMEGLKKNDPLMYKAFMQEVGRTKGYSSSMLDNLAYRSGGSPPAPRTAYNIGDLAKEAMKTLENKQALDFIAKEGLPGGKKVNWDQISIPGLIPGLVKQSPSLIGRAGLVAGQVPRFLPQFLRYNGED